MRNIGERVKIPKPEIPFGEEETVIQIPPGPREFREQRAAEQKERALREAREIINRAAEMETSLASLQYSIIMREQGPEAAKHILERLRQKSELRENPVILHTKLRERKDADRTLLDTATREINSKLGQKKITKEKAQQLLNKIFKDVSASGNLVVRNEVNLVALKRQDGKEQKVIWKPSSGEPLVKSESFKQGVCGIESQTQYLREWFARLVAEAASKGKYKPVVPETVIREIKDRIGSVQEFLEDSVTATSAKRKLGFSWEQANQEHLQTIAALDFILEMRDGHKGNFMVNKNGDVQAIDRALILTPEPLKYDIPPEKIINSYPLRLVRGRKILPAVREQLLALKEPQVQEILKKAAQFALGRDAEKLFNRMMKNLDRILAQDKRGASHFPHYEFHDPQDEKLFQKDKIKGEGKTIETPPTLVVRPH